MVCELEAKKECFTVVEHSALESFLAKSLNIKSIDVIIEHSNGAYIKVEVAGSLQGADKDAYHELVKQLSDEKDWVNMSELRLLLDGLCQGSLLPKGKYLIDYSW